jgi:hypothetical protein
MFGQKNKIIDQVLEKSVRNIFLWEESVLQTEKVAKTDERISVKFLISKSFWMLQKLKNSFGVFENMRIFFCCYLNGKLSQVLDEGLDSLKVVLELREETLLRLVLLGKVWLSEGLNWIFDFGHFRLGIFL